MLTGEDHERIVSWNHKAIHTQKTCMHYLVEAVARAMPHAEAVCSWDGSLSYSQLNNLSSIAARRLAKLGVEPGVFVPFVFEKSMWTVVATLAILKAGGAFVPLDPQHPESRLREIIASIGANIIVCSETLAPKFSTLVNCVAVISARTVNAKNCSSLHNFYSAVVHPSDPIFVLFTSGSTGLPKGMVHEHSAICTHAITHGEVMSYHGARVLQFAAYTFDVAIIDIFTTLIFGGTICIPSEEERMSNIIGAINNMKADYAILTPSFARVIKPSDVPTLKTLAVGGEALSQDGLKQWLEQVSVIQIYGPAEVGICLSIEMRLNKTRAETVGFPLPNCSCWLVDPDDVQKLVPVGAVGEMVVAGSSIARGYLNDEAKTKASFIDPPSWAKDLGLDDTRFFKTGDLLRYNTDSMDGSFDFVGRKDQQIKLRGQRVEPGEIEHHVACIPGVTISMATRPELGYFKGQLVLVVEMHSETSLQVKNEPISLLPNPVLTLEHVKEYLLRFLPGYMIPTTCLVVRRLPFVPSLKINRKKVEAWLESMIAVPGDLMGNSIGVLESSRLDPFEQTAIQLSSKIADIISNPGLTGLNFIFQAAGIDSIQIISFSLFLQQTYGIKLPIDILLNSSLTIRDLAALIDTRNESGKNVVASQTANLLSEYEATSRALFQTLESLPPLNQQRVPVKKVLITGATGYLGSAVLQNLLENSSVNVIALIHCNEPHQGIQRLISSARTKGWWKDDFSTRIQVWTGDLSALHLGLSSSHHSQLSSTLSDADISLNSIQAIIHSGAKVHYSSDFTSLKHTNITSTSILLSYFALSPHLHTFVFVSGGTQPDDDLTPSQLSTSPSLSAEIAQAGGYAHTKLVSEFLVADCAAHPAFSGKRICTIKPGYIVGSLEDGHSNKSDFIWRFVAGCVEIGAYNQEAVHRWLFIADVDLVAGTVVAPLFSESGEEESDGCAQTQRILDGLYFSELWELLRREFGWELDALSAGEWMERMKEAILAKGESHQLFSLMHVLERDGTVLGSARIPSPDLSAAAKERVGAVVKSNVRHLVDVGLIFPANLGKEVHV
ncbi:hypothetical protein BJ878DRAFT_570265 [Calycina marina]|uniref:Carrier domain-containing protein n=1 Tax=Calycina marina TaxID=1763456 RepID=A0A9P7YX37_9HELO|nr:hypothetical protein BJ878DRAFT_570265 [Calycina marina]